MQGVVVPSIAKSEMEAAALKAAQTRPALISGIFRKSAWEEFDEKAKTIRETNVSYYIEKSDGKTTTLRADGKVDESLLDQYVDYDPLTQSVSLGVKIPTKIRPEITRDEKEIPIKKVLVLLSEFDNSTPVNMTAEQYEQYLFGENGYIKKFYSEMTHGQVEFEADVRGWYHMYAPGSSFLEVPQLDYCGISAEGIQYMAESYDLDVTDYDIVVSVSNCEEYDNLGGRAYGSEELGVPFIRILGYHNRLDVNEMTNYVDWPGLVWNMVHEIGHTFGLGHSNSLDCGEETIGTNCQEDGYGNPFDAMGHWSGRIFNFLQQEIAGWIDEDNVLEITQSGAYHLDNIQTEGGVIGATISVPGISIPIFALEHRKPEGFDSGIPDGQINSVSNGLLLYSTKSWNADWGNYWRIVDSHPTEQLIYEDVAEDAITVATPFFDENFGIAISIIGISATGIDFIVDYEPENSICFQEPQSIDEIFDVQTWVGDHEVEELSLAYQDNFRIRAYFNQDAPQIICPLRHYSLVPIDEFTADIFDDGNESYVDDFTLSSFGWGYAGVGGDVNQSGQTIHSHLNFKIKDLTSLEEVYYSIPISIYGSACPSVSLSDLVVNQYLVNNFTQESVLQPEPINLYPGLHFKAIFEVTFTAPFECYFQIGNSVTASNGNISAGWLEYGNPGWDRMAPGETVTFIKEMSVPDNASPGAYYFPWVVSINYQAQTPSYIYHLNVIN